MLAQNTVLQILKYLALESPQSLGLLLREQFSDKFTLFENESKIRQAEQSNQDSQIIKYLDLFNQLEGILKDLENLSQCKEQKQWVAEVNNELCSKGLNWQFYAMFFILFTIMAMFSLGVGIFLSENVIRGLYNEEIKYVKTNKLRYDWN